MFGHSFFGAHFFGPHYFGPAVDASIPEPGTGGGGGVTAPNCDVTYLVDGSCPPETTAPGIIGPQGPPGPPGSECEWCCPLYCGDDSPEGVVEGEIGAPYEQANAAITTHPLWVKRANDGLNTGWRGWAGLRGSAAGSFAIGDNSVGSGIDSIAFGEDAQATGLRAEAFGKSSIAAGIDAKAFGAGAIVNADRGIAIGAGATVNVTATEGISIGDGIVVNPNDINIGWSNALSTVESKPNIVIGFDNTINTALDPSATTPTLYGGHVLIGYQTEVPYSESNWHNVAIGYQAKTRGRAVIAIGDLAEGRAINTPIAGISEGRFATIIGYAAKGSGGCIVSIGDQCDVRGDSAVAVGTNARANYHSTAAVGPNCIAGGATSTSGSGAAAFGVSATARGNGSLALGFSTQAQANLAISIGQLAFVNSLHEGAIALGNGANTKGPQSIMIGDDGSGGGGRQWAIHFNDNASPAILITHNGKLQFIADQLLTASTRTFPIAANITLDANDTNLLMSTTGGARTVTLPASAAVPIGTIYFIRRETATANSVTIVPTGAETIDGAANFILTAQWKWAMIQNDGIAGFEWSIVDNN